MGRAGARRDKANAVLLFRGGGELRCPSRAVVAAIGKHTGKHGSVTVLRFFSQGSAEQDISLPAVLTDMRGSKGEVRRNGPVWTIDNDRF